MITCLSASSEAKLLRLEGIRSVALPTCEKDDDCLAYDLKTVGFVGIREARFARLAEIGVFCPLPLGAPDCLGTPMHFLSGTDDDEVDKNFCRNSDDLEFASGLVTVGTADVADSTDELGIVVDDVVSKFFHAAIRVCATLRLFEGFTDFLLASFTVTPDSGQSKIVCKMWRFWYCAVMCIDCKRSCDSEKRDEHDNKRLPTDFGFLQDRKSHLDLSQLQATA